MSQIGFWGTAEPADPVAWGKRLLDIAIRRHRPDAVFGMFSGGHDSLCACHLASQHPAFTGVVHINTGIGVEATREFVRRTSREMGWALMEYCAEDVGQFYDSLVLEHGFPGPFHHRKMYNRLKERPLRRLIADTKRAPRGRVMLVTGVRRYESTRRMGTVQAINRMGSQVWVAPLAWFTSEIKARYMEDNGLPRNEVVDLLHMSGECLCGAFARPGELDWLEFCGFHEEVARIKNLQERARECGVPAVWGRPPREDEDIGAPGFLCVGCGSEILAPENGDE